MIHLASGFHDERSDAYGRWVRAESGIAFAPEPVTRFLDFWVLSEYYDLSQTLTVEAGESSVTIALPKGWSPASVEVPAGASEVRFRTNKILPARHHPADPRELAVRLRDLSMHADRARHRRVAGRQANAEQNAREMLGGQTTLASTPPSLGIDMYGACNVKPPCVYCGWDASKALEGDFVDAPFTVDTLREWGPMFEHSTNLVNCSIGEPFMMKNIDELLDTFADAGKTLELTTNGQILTDTNIRKLVGRPINLYISFDAATPETYAILRNRRFELLRDNVRRLIDAKGGPGRLPVVNVVFMPMRANVQELARFVEICADLRVDYLVLRPLNWAEKVDLNWERAGYTFEYEKELLPFDELVRTSGRAAELCRRAGVVLSDQMDFGGALGGQFADLYEEGRQSVSGSPEAAAAPPAAATAGPIALAAPASSTPVDLGADRTPACAEPWKSLYILRRGVFPCCYGGQPIAPMDQYRQVWSSPLLRDIRRDLAAGRFHQYCVDSPACPIVRKSRETEGRTTLGVWRLRTRAVAGRLDRHWRGVVWAGQWAGIRLRRAATEPGYATGQARRAVRRVLRMFGGA